MFLHMVKMTSTAARFQGHWVFLLKKYNNTHRTYLTVSVCSIAVCLQSSDGGLWGWATCEMNQCASWPSQWLDRQMVMVVWSPSVLVIHQQQVKNNYYSLCEASCRFFRYWGSFPSVKWTQRKKSPITSYFFIFFLLTMPMNKKINLKAEEMHVFRV